jgi:hypothetical protein
VSRGGKRVGAGRKPLDPLMKILVGAHCENHWRALHKAAVQAVIKHDPYLVEMRLNWVEIHKGGDEAGDNASNEYISQNPQHLSGLSQEACDIYLENWWTGHDAAVKAARSAYLESDTFMELKDSNKEILREKNGIPDDVVDSEQEEEEPGHEGEIMQRYRGQRFTAPRPKGKRAEVIEKVRCEIQSEYGLKLSQRTVESCWDCYRKEFPSSPSNHGESGAE